MRGEIVRDDVNRSPLWLTRDDVAEEVDKSGAGVPRHGLAKHFAGLAEAEIVDRLLSHPGHRQMLLNVKGLDARDAHIYREVDLRTFRSDLRGDVGILVVPQERPEEATVI